MSADLYIHIMTDDITEEDISMFFSHCMGTKYFKIFPNQTREEQEEWRKKDDIALQKISNTPQYWIGPVSWLKAAILNDNSYIPEPVQAVTDIVKEGADFPVIDDTLISKLVSAIGKENTSGYSVTNDEEKKESLRDFLTQYKGKKIFTVSW